MVIEEDPSVCGAVEEGQGVSALVNMLITGGNQGKKVFPLPPLFFLLRLCTFQLNPKDAVQCFH